MRGCHWIRISAAVWLAFFGKAALAQGGILGTKHNLSVSGPGTVSATIESEICVFCHTPHNASPLSPPLWNRDFSAANYVPYEGPSTQANPGQPNGYSKLCLSCHDGTIALGAVRNLRGQTVTIQLTGTGPGGTMPTGSTLIGTNLLNDHPVSFIFDQALASADGELVDPSTLTDRVRLYPGANPGIRDSIQCTTCHDPHTVEFPMFVRKSPKGQTDNLCLTCHQKPGWIGSTHESSTVFWPRNQASEQVRDHACFACHTPHTVENAERLLRDAAVGGQSAIEEVCYPCHRTAAAGGIVLDIETEMNKTYTHPVTLNPGMHKPVFITRPPAGLPENVLLDPGTAAEDPSFTDGKHVECVDCHNPHRVTNANRTEGMRGIALNGTVLENVVNDPIPADGQPSSRQYPVCLRCHGDTYATVIGVGTLPSGAQPSNKRTEFQTSNSSFHPIGGPGRNQSPNLDEQLQASALGTDSVIKCTDCHNSDSYEGTTGRVPSYGTENAPVGPHGSIYGSIRRAEYRNTLPGPANWNAANFNLCFRCHDVAALTERDRDAGARTNFYDDINGRDNLHEVHLIDQIDDSRPLCKSCHYNVHGNQEAPNTQYNIDGFVSNTPLPGTPTRLISFHPSILPIGGRARPEWWFNTVTRQRQCFLQCHNPNGSPGGEIMGGAAGESGGVDAEYRPDLGDLP